MSEEHAYTVIPSARYKRTRKIAKKQGLDMDLLQRLSHKNKGIMASFENSALKLTTKRCHSERSEESKTLRWLRVTARVNSTSLENAHFL